MRFSTKEQAEKHAVGRFAGYTAIWVGTNYYAIDNLPREGWYLWRRDSGYAR